MCVDALCLLEILPRPPPFFSVYFRSLGISPAPYRSTTYSFIYPRDEIPESEFTVLISANPIPTRPTTTSCHRYTRRRHNRHCEHWILISQATFQYFATASSEETVVGGRNRYGHPSSLLWRLPFTPAFHPPSEVFLKLPLFGALAVGSRTRPRCGFADSHAALFGYSRLPHHPPKLTQLTPLPPTIRKHTHSLSHRYTPSSKAITPQK